MPSPRARATSAAERAFLVALVAHLDQVSLENYLSGIDGAIGQLCQFAHGYWANCNSPVLWEASAPVWRKIRDSLSGPDGHQGHRQVWSAPVRTNIEEIAFLAAVATSDYEATTKAAARRQLMALVTATADEGGPDNRALQLLAGTILRSRVVERVSPDSLVVTGEMVTSELATLTARAFSAGGRSFFEEERDRSIAASLRSAAIDKPGVAEVDLLKRLDSAQQLPEKDEALYALQVIGGCRVAQELGARLVKADAEVQCAILSVLERLAQRPYRPGTLEKEVPTIQLETIDHLLRVLGQLFLASESDQTRQLIKSANEAVTVHRAQCFNAHP